MENGTVLLVDDEQGLDLGAAGTLRDLTLVSGAIWAQTGICQI